MYARGSTLVIEPQDAKQGAGLIQVVITVAWALLATLSLFAFLGAVALFVI